MGFNYAQEKRRFDQDWDRHCRESAEAGMSPESIQRLYEFDLEFFRSQRRYRSHTQELTPEADGAKDASTLLCRFANGTSTFSESDFPGRHAWVDTIENQQLAMRLKQLSGEDLELLTLLVLEERSQRETARILGCSQSSISQEYKRIKFF